MSPLPISAVIITLNEERELEDCLRSLQGVVDEVLILDSGSTDGAQAIAEVFGARFISTEWLGFGPTKNKANQLARHDTILSIDADERLSPELARSIAKLSIQSDAAYSFNRYTQYCGRWIRHAGWYPDVKTRLFNRGKCHWNGELVHEELQIPEHIKRIHIQGDLLHHSYRSKQEHIDRLKRYTRLAVARNGKPKGGAIGSLFAALGKFVHMYIVRAGFLDGKAGFQLCSISAMAKWWAYRMD